MIIVYSFCCKAVNSIIKEFYLTFDIKTIVSANEALLNIENLIEIIKRTLLLVLVISNQSEVIVFLIAVKSILGYQEANTIQTEYLLIVAMTSFATAIYCGILIKKC